MLSPGAAMVAMKPYTSASGATLHHREHTQVRRHPRLEGAFDPFRTRHGAGPKSEQARGKRTKEHKKQVFQACVCCGTFKGGEEDKAGRQRYT